MYFLKSYKISKFSEYGLHNLVSEVRGVYLEFFFVHIFLAMLEDANVEPSYICNNG